MSIYSLAYIILLHQLKFSDKRCNNMRLQKLAYFCYGFSLAKGVNLLYNNKEEQLNSPFCVWPYGAINEDLYYTLKYFHDKEIPVDFLKHLSFVYDGDVIAENIKTIKFIHMILDKLSHLSTFELVGLNKMDESPVKKMLDSGLNNQLISNDEIYCYFSN